MSEELCTYFLPHSQWCFKVDNVFLIFKLRKLKLRSSPSTLMSRDVNLGLPVLLLLIL